MRYINGTTKNKTQNNIGVTSPLASITDIKQINGVFYFSSDNGQSYLPIVSGIGITQLTQAIQAHNTSVTAHTDIRNNITVGDTNTLNSAKAYTDTEIKNINSIKIQNKGVINVTTADDIQVVCTNYIQTNYGREPLDFDGLYLTFTDRPLPTGGFDKVLYVYSATSNVWIDGGTINQQISQATPTVAGIAKLFQDRGNALDGAISQDAFTRIVPTDDEKAKWNGYKQVVVEDVLTSTSVVNALSANMGKQLDTIKENISAKLLIANLAIPLVLKSNSEYFVTSDGGSGVSQLILDVSSLASGKLGDLAYLTFDSGTTATSITWQAGTPTFIGSDCLNGIFIPLAGKHYEISFYVTSTGETSPLKIYAAVNGWEI